MLFTMKWELKGKNKFAVFLSSVLADLSEKGAGLSFTQLC